MKIKLLIFFSLILIFLLNFFNKSNLYISSSQDSYIEKIFLSLKEKPNNFILKANQPQFNINDQKLQSLNSYIVIDKDRGEILAEKDYQKPFKIASLTKIMTAIIALDLAKENEEFTISRKAAGIVPTKIGVVPGQKMTVEELLNALLLTSANDAAQVIKEGIDKKYGYGVFIKAMNEKVKLLGLRNTHFDNPQGFDSKNNYSSAYDLALLSSYALSNYPLIAEIAKKEYEFLPGNNKHKMFDLYNWNGLLGVYPGVNGLKIGNTRLAKVTSIVSAQRNKKNIIVVILGAENILERDTLAAKLLDFGFNKIDNLSFANITEAQLGEKYSTWRYF